MYGDPVRIQSAEIRYINIEDLIPRRFRNERNWGGLSLTYMGFNREMWSQFRFLGVNGGGNVDEFFTVKEESRSDLFEAVWWMPKRSEAIIALGNITDTETSATVSFNDGRARTVKLRPHETELLRSHERGNDGAESVKIEVTGAPGSIVPTGIITAKDGSFNSVIRFYSPRAVRQPHLFANGFRLAGIAPHMILKNTSSSSISVQPEFIPFSGRFTGDRLTLPQIDLGPHEVTEVDLSALQTAARHGRGMKSVSVQVTNSGAPGSLIGSLYGINEDGISYDVPLRDSGPPRAMTGSYPWKITDDFTTLVYVTNISDQEAQFTTQINYAGGSLFFAPRNMAPGETAVFDLKKIRDEGTKDLADHQLPREVSQGQFKWTVRGMTNGKLVLIGRAEMVSRSQRISSSYSCNDPCPPYYVGDINPFPPPIVINESAVTAVWETAYYDTGYISGPYSTTATWNPIDPIATIDPTWGHIITATGTAEGVANLHGFIAMQQDYGWDGLNCYEYGYYEEFVDAPIEVGKVILETVTVYERAAQFDTTLNIANLSLQGSTHQSDTCGSNASNPFEIRVHFLLPPGATLAHNRCNADDVGDLPDWIVVGTATCTLESGRRGRLVFSAYRVAEQDSNPKIKAVVGADSQNGNRIDASGTINLFCSQ